MNGTVQLTQLFLADLSPRLLHFRRKSKTSVNQKHLRQTHLVYHKGCVYEDEHGPVLSLVKALLMTVFLKLL